MATVTIHHAGQSVDVEFDPSGPIVDISDAFLSACYDLGLDDDRALERAEWLTFRNVDAPAVRP